MRIQMPNALCPFAGRWMRPDMAPKVLVLLRRVILEQVDIVVFLEIRILQTLVDSRINSRRPDHFDKLRNVLGPGHGG